MSLADHVSECLESGDWEIADEWPSGLIMVIGDNTFKLEEIEES